MKKLVVSLLSVTLLFLLAGTVFAADDIVYDFKIDRNTDGWSPVNTTLDAKDGVLFGTATTNGGGTYDPFIMHSADFSAADYKYVVVSMKYAMERVLSTTSQLYFSTDTKGISEPTRVASGLMDAKTSGDKYITIVFDMSTNENWTGKVKNLRLDMISSSGTYSIDSIQITNTLPSKYDVITESSSSSPSGGNNTADAEQFKKSSVYKDGTFTDLNPSDWFYKEVISANELGLMNGTSEASFDPNGTVTVKQALALAARIHNIYNGGDGKFTQDAADWAKVYIDYAAANKFLDVVDFDNYDRTIRRWEMAKIFAAILPEKYYAAQNTVCFIPDVAPSTSYKDALFTLYNAGIIMGNDAYGTFYPRQ